MLIYILNKTTKPKEPEYNLFEQHPEIGYSIIKGSMISKDILDIMFRIMRSLMAATIQRDLMAMNRIVFKNYSY